MLSHVKPRVVAVFLLMSLSLAASGQALSPAGASTALQAVPASRVNHLRHGVNLSHWFSQSRSYDAQHLATYDTAADFDLIRTMGFDHVRFTIEPAPLFNQGQPDQLDAAYLERIDAVVQMAVSRDLAILLDIHPSDEFKQKLGRDEKQVENFTDFWRSLAAHFAGSDPERVFLEVLNEPEVFDAYRWQGIQARLVSAIRSVAPRHTIVVTGGGWSGLDDMLVIEPLRDRNLIYNFHYYTPFLFTHQSATWATEIVHHLRGVHYPSKPGADDALVASLPEFRQRIEVVRYDQDRWDRARIDAEIGQVAAWAAAHNVPVTCNEFGVFRQSADADERAAWLRDVRSSLEAHHIGWAVWDYAADFGVATGEPGKRVPDERDMKALGLK